jgi:predicted Zn-dependent peptidase
MKYFAPILSFVVNKGSLSDLNNKTGTYSAALSNIKFSNKKFKTPRDILFNVESVGGSYSYEIGKEYAMGSIRIPILSVNEGKILLDNLLKDSVVTDESLNIVKLDALNDINELNIDTLSYAKTRFAKELAGIEYSSGTIDSIKNIKKSDVENALQNIQKSSVFVKLEDPECPEIIGKFENQTDDRKITKTSNILHLEQKNIPQTHLFLGFLTKGGSDYTQEVVAVANETLGNFECGLALQRIREEKSAAYSVSVGHTLSRSYGVHYYYAGIAKENLEIVVKEIMTIIRELTSGQLKDEVFETSKNITIGRYKKTADNPDMALRFYVQQVVNKNGSSKIKTFSESINILEKVRKDDVLGYFLDLYKKTVPFLYAYGDTEKQNKDKLEDIISHV